MKKIVLILVAIFTLSGCTTTSDISETEDETIQLYEETIMGLENQLSSIEDEVTELNEYIEELEFDLDTVTDENIVLRQEIETYEDIPEVDTEMMEYFNELVAEGQAYRELVQLRDDIPTNEYTLEELTVIYEDMQDGYDLNHYGAYVAQIYFDNGIEEFIDEIAKLEDEETRQEIANVFVHNILSFRESYFVNDIPLEIAQEFLENKFYTESNKDITEDELEVIRIVIGEVWETYKWYN